LPEIARGFSPRKKVDGAKSLSVPSVWCHDMDCKKHYLYALYTPSEKVIPDIIWDIFCDLLF
jgi:hypothetical protein